LNKSLTTNITSAILVIIGYFWKWEYQEYVFNIGLFALSGGITNWLAIHMLFEKVPGLYGSGVIPSRFEDFKLGIRKLMMNQFFTKENVDKFLDGSSLEQINLTPIIQKTDFSPMFEALTLSVLESPFGAMVSMFGGEAVLEKIREPFIKKMKQAVIDVVSTQEFHQRITDNLVGKDDKILDKITLIVQKRLDELTSQKVKEIIQDMIRKHLGWLVVWGGIFGGLIGLASSIIRL